MPNNALQPARPLRSHAAELSLGDTVEAMHQPT